MSTPVVKTSRYKIVETMTVTDAELEEIINDGIAQGFVFEGIQFAMRESSKRPAMAFVLFTTTHPDLTLTRAAAEKG